MELKCKNCGAIISAENINIQKTLAVCAECNHVFDFSSDVLMQKAKQRKVRQPERLHVDDSGGRLEMAYRRVFSQEDKVVLGISACIAVFITFIFLVAAGESDTPPLLLFIVGLIPLAAAYIWAASMGNTTRAVLDEQTLMINCGPLPLPDSANKDLERHNVVRVFCEETEDSQKKGSLTRYYHVCAELTDGNRAILIKGIPQDYAFYIAQRLDADLQADADEAAVNLSDDSGQVDADEIAHLTVETSGVDNNATEM